MTRNEVKEMVNKHNKDIDNFINKKLPQILRLSGVSLTIKDNGEYVVPMSAWFKAQQFIDCMDFYSDAMKIINLARPLGFDLKINMQTNKLVLY